MTDDKKPTREEALGDSYHTMSELYEHRHALFSALLRTLGGWRSRFDADGVPCEAGWFIAGLDDPNVTYHMPESWWTVLDGVDTRDRSTWDGHTADDVVSRLRGIALQAPARPTREEALEALSYFDLSLCVRMTHSPELTAMHVATLRAYLEGEG